MINKPSATLHHCQSDDFLVDPAIDDLLIGDLDGDAQYTFTDAFACTNTRFKSIYTTERSERDHHMLKPWDNLPSARNVSSPPLDIKQRTCATFEERANKAIEKVKSSNGQRFVLESFLKKRRQARDSLTEPKVTFATEVGADQQPTMAITTDKGFHHFKSLPFMEKHQNIKLLARKQIQVKIPNKSFKELKEGERHFLAKALKFDGKTSTKSCFTDEKRNNVRKVNLIGLAKSKPINEIKEKNEQFIHGILSKRRSEQNCFLLNKNPYFVGAIRRVLAESSKSPENFRSDSWQKIEKQRGIIIVPKVIKSSNKKFKNQHLLEKKIDFEFSKSKKTDRLH